MVAQPAEQQLDGDPVALLTGVRIAVDQLRTAAPEVGARAWEHHEREAIITGLDGVLQDLKRYQGKVLLAHRADGRWGTARDRDFVDWRSRTTGSGRGAAMGELQVAEGLEAMPEVDAAVVAGELTLEHAKVLSRLRNSASEEVRSALDNGMAAELATKAKDLTAPELARAAKRIAATVDAKAAQESFDATWRRRSLTLGRSGGARTGAWVLDDVSGTLVETALDAIAGAPAQDDERTRAQRHVDALVTMASRTLQVGSDLNGAQIRPHLAVITDEETWVAARRHRQAIEAATEAAVNAVHGDGAAFGLGADGRPSTTAVVDAANRSGSCGLTGSASARPALPELPAVAPAELEDGSLVPLGELIRLMCDCEMTRVVMDADSTVLDVGMTQRTYAKELRRAVTTRDRRCQWPGCRIRASWSEVHHIVWYSNGGPTSVENGICACTFHHHVIHRDNVRIVHLADGFAFYGADGSLIGTNRREPRRRNAGRQSGESCADPKTLTDAPADDRTPARTAEHTNLVDAWQQVRNNNGPAAPPDNGSEGRALPTKAEGGSPPGATSKGTALPPVPTQSKGTALSAVPTSSKGTAPSPVPTLWDVSLRDQPAEPPF